MSEPTSTEYPEEGQPVTTPEPAIEAIEAVEEAAVEAEALDLADVADDYEAEVGTAAEIPACSATTGGTTPASPVASAAAPELAPDRRTTG